ncbi:uncharacterized protein SCHCODRAFT_02715891, partial [Schizophyllum commune H4-8]|uniref:uncharacterized protein n=1 Tax=Schizophyllum commune (strain H4-8 / FGSC 9210) TaxID=578458 RepID=UPI00215F0CFA
LRPLPCLQAAVSSEHNSIQYDSSGQLQATSLLNREVTGALNKSPNDTARIDANAAARMTGARTHSRPQRTVAASGRPMTKLASISWRLIRPSKQIFSVSWCSNMSGSSLFNSTFASRQQINSITPSKPLISKKTSTSLVRNQTAQIVLMSDASSVDVPCRSLTFLVLLDAALQLHSLAHPRRRVHADKENSCRVAQVLRLDPEETNRLRGR